MKENKIIFTGPVGVGKTTAIAALSDDPPVKTDARASDMTLVRKGHTTVAMDYGVIRLDGDTKVHLYGTPGQERFNFMWEILSKGSMGLILLLDNTRANPLKDLTFFLDAFKDLLKTAPLVVGVTRWTSGHCQVSMFIKNIWHNIILMFLFLKWMRAKKKM